MQPSKQASNNNFSDISTDNLRRIEGLTIFSKHSAVVKDDVGKWLMVIAIDTYYA